MKAFIYPYKKGSRSAKALAQAVDGKVIKLENSRFRSGPNKMVINWGNSNCIYTALNAYDCVARAGNKLAAFAELEAADVPIPEYTRSVGDALGWRTPFMARTKLTGHSGEGCYFVDTEQEDNQYIPPDAKLFVKYIKKKEEYRVHVFQGKVIDIQQKKKRNGFEDADFKIRSHQNGWVFARNDINPPDCVREHAIAAVAALGLDFGAVDIIWNQYYQKAYVLEVNTAPGLEGSTVEAYANAIKEIL